MTDIPQGLNARGSIFWEEIHDDLEFDARDAAIVLEACRVLDVIDELTAAVDRDGVMTVGSTGQPVVHPGVAEIRMQQATFARLMGSLKLPDDDAANDRFRHERAKAGAAARWYGPKAVG
ncbi:hypothetical protein EV141_0188 [Microcella putealis]|uniref:Phage terminase small subunit n=1 Tax=Microcella putealis TaxID=337005 RepID=A0A4Q7LV18_9MICO|nr:hypothetical protein [Microcella putealis]RZS58975.1 hypothetical protein EV141_0188 [Microcella putealis]TQM24001.1 hypothetical protein BJ957_1467 [Microcella putealis]